MNQQLTEQIIRHVYNCLGAKLPNKKSNVQSIMQPEYLSSKKISFEDGDKNIWAVEFDFDKNEDLYFHLMIAELTEENIPEYALIVSAKNSPTYAAYLAYGEYNTNSDEEVDRSMIACSLQNESWAECNVYLQASFLCGMEKIREIASSIKKLENKELYDKLISFIKYYQNTMERENEG